MHYFLILVLLSLNGCFESPEADIVKIKKKGNDTSIPVELGSGEASLVISNVDNSLITNTDKSNTLIGSGKISPEEESNTSLEEESKMSLEELNTALEESKISSEDELNNTLEDTKIHLEEELNTALEEEINTVPENSKISLEDKLNTALEEELDDSTLKEKSDSFLEKNKLEGQDIISFKDRNLSKDCNISNIIKDKSKSKKEINYIVPEYKFTFTKAKEFAEIMGVKISDSFKSSDYSQIWLSSGEYYDSFLDANFSAYPDEYRPVVFEGVLSEEKDEFNLTNLQANWYVANTLCREANQSLPTIEEMKRITYQNLDKFTGEFWTSEVIDNNSSIFRVVGKDEKYFIEKHMQRMNYKGVLCVPLKPEVLHPIEINFNDDTETLIETLTYEMLFGVNKISYLEKEYYIEVGPNEEEPNLIYPKKIEYGVWTLDDNVVVTYSDHYQESFTVVDNYSTIWLLKDRNISSINAIDNFSFEPSISGTNIAIWKSPKVYSNLLDNGCSIDNPYCDRVEYNLKVIQDCNDDISLSVIAGSTNQVELERYFLSTPYLFVSLENNSTYVVLTE